MTTSLSQFKKDLSDTMIDSLSSGEGDMEDRFMLLCKSVGAVVHVEGSYALLDGEDNEIQLSKCFTVSPNGTDWVFVDIKTGVVGSDVSLKHLTESEATALGLPTGEVVP